MYRVLSLRENLLFFLLLSFFSIFVFSIPSKVVIIVIEFMFLDIILFWVFLRAHCSPCLAARAKMSLSRAQNIFMPANINSIVLLSKLTKFPSETRTSVHHTIFSVIFTVYLYVQMLNSHLIISNEQVLCVCLFKRSRKVTYGDK